MDIKISIVIISWNVKDLLLDCINPFYDREEIQLVIVDNNSHDGTVEELKERYPHITLVENKGNPGFAKANNQGFRYCKGRYTYILNPDTVSSYEDLQKLVQVLDEKAQVGGVSPKILYGNGVIQGSCARRLPNLMSYVLFNAGRLSKLPVLGSWLVRKVKSPYDYNQSGYIEACSGAAYLVRTELLKELDGFNPVFVHTGEDVDLMRRIMEAGYKNYYCAESTLIHYAGQSSKQNIARVQINTFISTWYYYRLSKGRLSAFLFRLSILMVDMPIRMFRSLMRTFFTRDVQALKEQIKILKGVIGWKFIR